MNRAEADAMLRSTGWLALVPPTFADEVLRRSILASFGPNEAMFRFGDPPGGIYGLVSGALTVNSAPPDAVPQLIHLGLQGAWTGEGSFMTGQPRRGELRALSPVQMMHLPLAEMERLAGNDVRAAKAFGTITVLGVDVLIRVIHDLQKRDADKRIAAVVHRLAGVPTQAIPLSQTELGIMANASRKQVNAALQRFAASGWLAKGTGYRAVSVIDPRALRAFSEEE
ncbi:Crp/Fnr family transcriptional regulator [Enterovirga rhinocerotis]